MKSEFNRWVRWSHVAMFVVIAACTSNRVDNCETTAHSSSEQILAASLLAWPGAQGDVFQPVRVLWGPDLFRLSDALETLLPYLQPTDVVPNSPARCTIALVDGRGKRGAVSLRLDYDAPYLLLSGEHFAGTIGLASAGRINIDMNSEQAQYWRSLFNEAAPASVLGWAEEVAREGDEVCRRISAFQAAFGKLPSDLPAVAAWDGGRRLIGLPQPVAWLYMPTSASEYELRGEILIWGEMSALLVYASGGRYPIEWISAATLVKCIGKWIFIGDSELVEAMRPGSGEETADFGDGGQGLLRNFDDAAKW